MPLPLIFPHAEELFVNGTKVTWETLTRDGVRLSQAGKTSTSL